MLSDFDSLLRDMLRELSDSNSPAGRDTGDEMQEAMFALERQLDTAGAHVVMQQAPAAAHAPLANTEAHPHDAWISSLSNFEALQLADDFVRADVAFKKRAAPLAAALHMDDYDLTDNTTQTIVPSATHTNMQPPVTLPLPAPALPNMQPTHAFLPTTPTPYPLHTFHMFPPTLPPPPPTTTTTAAVAAVAGTVGVPMPPARQPHRTPPTYPTQDFPPLGTFANEQQRVSSATQSPAATIRLLFHDTSPHAPPISAATIPTSCMTPRDLCYVIHSMLKPVLSFASVLDMYNADYYKWGYDQRRQVRNTGFVYPTHIPLPNPVWKETKQTAKTMEQEYLSHVEKRADEWSKDKQSLGKLVKIDVKRPRALLATSLVMKKRDKDMTSTTTDYTDEPIDLDEAEEEEEEDTQRLALWKARIAIDQGYQAYLNLVELRRLLQTRGKQHVSEDHLNPEFDTSQRRLELLDDVETHVHTLHTALGFRKQQQGENESTVPIMTLDEKILAQTLSLPKGKVLVSRIMDEGILPHSSACRILAMVLEILLHSHEKQYRSVCQTKKGTKVQVSFSSLEEDRLLRSLTGLVRLVHPSPSPQNMIDSLMVVNEFSNPGKKRIPESKQLDMKVLLSSHRTLLDLLHAILSRGGDICRSAGEYFLESWESQEKEFVAVLTRA